jgi:hypothetical protein
MGGGAAELVPSLAELEGHHAQEVYRRRDRGSLCLPRSAGADEAPVRNLITGLGGSFSRDAKQPGVPVVGVALGGPRTGREVQGRAGVTDEGVAAPRKALPRCKVCR